MKKLLYILLFALGLSSVYAVNAQQPSKKNFNLKNGIAIQGYDPVAYFTEKVALVGKQQIKAQFNGVTYLFSSEDNKNRFLKSPEKYEPAYGGYCAYAMAFGDKVKIDPKTFKVKNGRLFLFYNFGSNNTLLDWNKSEIKLLNDAEREWAEIVSNR